MEVNYDELEDYIRYHDKQWKDDILESLRKARTLARNAQDDIAYQAIDFLYNQAVKAVNATS